jgi:hypothetical protein
VRAYIYKHPSGYDPIEIVPLEEEMVFGELMVQKVGMVVTTFMKYAYTTLVLMVQKCYANDPYARGYAKFSFNCLVQVISII